MVGSDLVYSHNHFVPVLTTLEQLAPRLGAYLTVQHDRKRAKVSELRKFAERHG